MKWPVATWRWWVALAPLAILHLPNIVLHPHGPSFALLAAFVILASVPWLIPALLVRGALWFALLGSAIASFTLSLSDGLSAKDAPEVLRVIYPVAWALLWLGRPDTGTRSTSFAPAAFRGTLLAAMLLGCADGVWLGLATVDRLWPPRSTDPWLTAMMGVGCLAALFAVWGTSRLKLWGVLLGLLCNVGILSGLVWWLVLTHDRGSGFIAVIFGTGAVLHTLLQVPLLVAMRTGRTPRWASSDLKGAGTVVVLAVTLAVTVRLALG